MDIHRHSSMKDTCACGTMTMEISSNNRDCSTLQLSVEQWELLRRLRNSRLTKTQIIRAYDELDRLDRELGNLFNSAPAPPPPPPPLPSSTSTVTPSVDSVSPPTTITQQISPSSVHNNKRPHSLTVNGVTTRSSTVATNGYHPHPHHHHHHHSQQQQQQQQHTTISPSVGIRSRNGGETNSSIGNQHESLTQIDAEEETRELQELLAKGDVAIHNEISVFVYRYDLKQSQIARMAAVNQAYVSKFLRGDLFDLSENGRMAICRWYLRYRKIVQCMGGGQPSVELLASLTSSCDSPPSKIARLSESQANNNVAFEAPKRTRFTFRPEHLDILEKSFLDNPYPDPRRREDIARVCNDARTRIDGCGEVLNERDRVTDAIVTHWFQNKRKMTKNQRVSIQDDSIPLSGTSNSNSHTSATMATNEYENGNGDDDPHLRHQQKPSVAVVDVDCYEPSTSSLLDPQMAAYRAIMSRIVPFSNVNGTALPKQLVKQEPIISHDGSSQDDESNSASPLDDNLSP